MKQQSQTYGNICIPRMRHTVNAIFFTGLYPEGFYRGVGAITDTSPAFSSWVVCMDVRIVTSMALGL